MDFLEAATRLGFSSSQDRPSRGGRTYTARPNHYLTYYVYAYDDGTALFTWEFAITDYLLERGIQVGSSETLNLFMFPREDLRGPQDAAWLAGAIDQELVVLRSIHFADPEG